MKHYHIFHTTYALGFHQVRRCSDCGQAESLIRDLDTGNLVWVSGNLWEPKNEPFKLFLFMDPGERKTFSETSKLISSANPLLRKEDIFPLYRITEWILEFNKRVPIVLTGNWWENDSISTPEFAKFFNRKMTGET